MLLIRAGLPPPQTQIAVHDEWGYGAAYLDMGWKDLKIAVEYDGDHHRTDRFHYVKDIRRLEMLERMGWIVIRVIAEDHPDDILRRVRAALARRRLSAAYRHRETPPSFARWRYVRGRRESHPSQS